MRQVTRRFLATLALLAGIVTGVVGVSGAAEASSTHVPTRHIHTIHPADWWW